ncbi:MAG: sortase [Bacilli bacterium]|nr:sortase [Bacilli bacterium]
MLKKVISIIMIFLSIIILFYNHKEIKDNQDNIDEIIDNKLTSNYDGYISFKNNKLLIKIGTYNDVLNKNLVLMISNKDIINKEYGNIILAGHNNKYVFNNLYKLNINDEIIISDFKNKYKFIVEEKKYVNIKDKSILDNIYNDKILTLITCTNNNQIRYVVIGKLKSHNFT